MIILDHIRVWWHLQQKILQCLPVQGCFKAVREFYEYWDMIAFSIISRHAGSWNLSFLPSLEDMNLFILHNIISAADGLTTQEARSSAAMFWPYHPGMFRFGTRVGVTKAPFVNFCAGKTFDPTKVPVRFICITFIFDRCHRSSAAATPVKYERANVFWWCWWIRKITERKKLV